MVGKTLGHYRILEPLGAGGMGEVYLAEDTRLGRKVAIKVLPPKLSEDPAFRQRFEREAKTISQLQHPNVCTLHDVGSADGVEFLVMEYLEGPTLEQHLRRGALPVAEVVRIGSEIAEAIHAAHRGGVVHRDLKPGNVMLTESGTKVVDFGLAKGFGGGDSMLDTKLATTLEPATADGSIVGTLHYMAPEQLEGKDVDARADIWALGCILYEMTAGARPFSSESTASLIGSILKDEPERLSRTQPLAPRRLDWIVGRCLSKDRERRWQSARDVAIELQSVLEAADDEESDRPVAVAPALSARRVAAWVASIGISVALTWVALGPFGLGAPAPLTTSAPEFSIRQLTGRPAGDTVHSAALSPDGEQLAFATREGLFLQIVATGEERQVPTPEELQVLEVDWIGATDLLFSASTADGFGLYKSSVFGGSARKLTDGAWRAAVSADGAHIAYLEGVPARVLTVTGPDGEDPRSLLDLGTAGSMWEIAWSPDARWLLVGIWGGAATRFDMVLEAIDLDSGERKVVLDDPRFFQSWRGFLPFLWTADDRLVVGRREVPPAQQMANLWQAPIDRSTASVGELTRLTRLVGINPKDLSATQDGGRLVFVQERSQSDLMVAEIEDGGRRLGRIDQLTVDVRNDEPFAWGPDGLLFFESDRSGVASVFRTTVAGGRPEFVAEKGDETGFGAVVQDGASILYWRGRELVQVPATGGPSRTLLAAGIYPGIDCIEDGRCWVGERSADERTYVFYAFDSIAGRRGEEVLRIEDRPPFTNWDVSPDGTRVVVGHNDDSLRIFDLATDEETTLTYEGLSYGEFPAWSADGRGIFVDGGYATRGRLHKGLLYISLDDGEAHVLRLNWGEWNIRPQPSPDGAYLAFGANFFYDGNAWMIEGY